MTGYASAAYRDSPQGCGVADLWREVTRVIEANQPAWKARGNTAECPIAGEAKGGACLQPPLFAWLLDGYAARIPRGPVG
ncbi:hypothetical protein DM084_30030, partial [Klebsiella pneumoniae]